MPEMLAQGSLFYLFLKLVPINFIFSNMYIYQEGKRNKATTKN
jgi:hypothetical protein